MTSRKIESGCYARVRGTDRVVQVLKRHGSCGPYGPPTWDASDNYEYFASELKRISKKEYYRLQDAPDFFPLPKYTG